MTLDYASCEYYLAATQLVLATLGMGVSLKVTDFGQLLRAPKAIALVLAAQLFLAPLMVMALASGLSLPPGIVPGMVLMMAMPVGALANIFCYLGRGNMPLAVSATAISTLGCLITAAAVVRCFGSAHFPVEFSMPVGRVVLEGARGFHAIGHVQDHRAPRQRVEGLSGEACGAVARRDDRRYAHTPRLTAY